MSESTLKPTVLLIKRRNHLYWRIRAPGGFVEIDEEEAAAKRELFEEASIQLDKMYEYGSFEGWQRPAHANNIDSASGHCAYGRFFTKRATTRATHEFSH